MIVSLLLAATPMVTPACVASVTTFEINRCEGQRFAQADRRMNQQWKLSIAAMRRRDAGLQDPRSVPPSFTDALLAAQRAWLSYRDSNCLVVGYRMRGGTGAPARESACRTALTIARTQELRDQVKGY